MERKRVGVIVVDDHFLTLKGTAVWVAENSAYDLVGEALNGREALDLTLALSPDLLLLDLFLPDMSGIEVLKQLQNRASFTKVLILSNSHDFSEVQACLQNGARGFIRKSSNSQILEQAIQTVLTGRLFLDPFFKNSLNTISLLEEAQSGLAEQPVLTERERELIKLMACGIRKTEELASKLSISANTVNNHIKAILTKLGVNSRVEAIQLARKLGITDEVG